MRSLVNYFAYASNMDSRVMQQHCPGHRFQGIAYLEAHRLSFTRRSVRTGGGVADVVKSAGDHVWGVLYELEESDLRCLDHKEGNGIAYQRQLYPVCRQEGRGSLEAVVYTVIERESMEVPPTRLYARGLLQAASDRALPDAYIEWLTDLVARLSAF
jgi:gamma-glutamylcyclotransferase